MSQIRDLNGAFEIVEAGLPADIRPQELGAFVALSLMDIDGKIFRPRYFTQAITTGATTVAVVFPASMQFAPAVVHAQLLKLNHSDSNASYVTTVDSITKLGCNVNLAAASPAGAQLMVLLS
jgi:hypothetical protein